MVECGGMLVVWQRVVEFSQCVRLRSVKVQEMCYSVIDCNGLWVVWWSVTEWGSVVERGRVG